MSAELKVRLASDGQGLEITTPGGHSVKTSELHVGKVLMGMLFSMQEAPAGKQTLGTPSAPTQSMVDDFIRKGGRVQQIGPIGPKPKAEDITLEALGL